VSDEEVTHDTLLRGRVTIVQPVRGYRTSLDPVLLGAFLAPPFGRFVDLGCGTGALAFVLLARDPGASGVGVELQPRLARLAARGIERNDFGGRFRVETGDVRALARTLGTFDLVAANPPYRPVGTGVLPPDAERSLANHEVSLALREWLDAAVKLMAPDGRLGVVFPADRLPELRAGLEGRGLATIRLRLVIPQAGEPARRVLVEARWGRAALAEEPPLVVHERGAFTEEARRWLEEA
jgi:tRNA1(Val) A37 N6-methylase TrmN6